MKKNYNVIWLFFIFYLMNISCVFAFHGPTHEAINEYIVNKKMNGFSLEEYLKEQLGFADGINEKFETQKGECKLQDIYKVADWVKHGGSWEDDPPGPYFQCFPYIRAFNHFYNPLSNEGLSKGWAWGNPTDRWFMLSEAQDEGIWVWDKMGRYSWKDVREYFHKALTSADEAVREDAFADTFRGLGQLMHLAEDMAVPLHTRNDLHIFSGYIEDWIQKKVGDVEGAVALYSPSASYHFFEASALKKIIDLFDTDTYEGK